MHKEEKNYIFGIHPIIEAIESGRTIDKLFIQKGLHNELFSKLWKLVRLKRINYKHVPLEKINRLTMLVLKEVRIQQEQLRGQLQEQIAALQTQEDLDKPK